MSLPDHKTKIVATIGPASESPDMLERLIRGGMNVARLNFSHGDFRGHAERIARIRAAAKTIGQRVAIMADLPGPKMRIGKLDPEPITLRPGDRFALTTEDVVGTARRVSMSFDRLPQVVKPGDRLFLNDGLVQLTVERATGPTWSASWRWAANSGRGKASTSRASTWASAPSRSTIVPVSSSRCSRALMP
jgi:pyruvate kinase